LHIENPRQNNQENGKWHTMGRAGAPACRTRSMPKETGLTSRGLLFSSKRSTNRLTALGWRTKQRQPTVMRARQHRGSPGPSSHRTCCPPGPSASPHCSNLATSWSTDRLLSFVHFGEVNREWSVWLRCVN
jgi:hypothetical protein